MDAVTMRTTQGRGWLFASVLETVGDTPAIRINNLAPASFDRYLKQRPSTRPRRSRTCWRSTSLRRPNATEASVPARRSSRQPRATPVSVWRWSAWQRATRWS